ncbi:DUF2336 domain-containing protein, partial [Sphingomonas sp. CCH9-H8]
MSDPNVDMSDGAAIRGARTLLAHAAGADAAAYRGLATAIDDFFLPESHRLDERTRVGLGRLLRALVDTVEGEIRDHGVRQLQVQGETDLAAVLAEADGVFAALSESGLLRDAELMAELIAQVRQELLASGMPVQAHDDPERPSLINRFVQHPDRVLAQSAMGVLIAESRRRSLPEAGPLPQTDLPAELHHKLVWWVAAALRARVTATAQLAPPDVAALDRVLAEAAQRSLAAHDEGDRVEAAVMRLAVAIDAQPDELPELLNEALGDRRVTLFAGLLAHALGVDYAVARGLALDAGSGRLWVALRALDLDRGAIARLGLALTEADPRRDIEAFAETLDTIMA